ncbi:MAG TPA: hypothetical protein VMV25_09475 [Steroidobacteraceae bacterium]|nr:hypothetical protein [Steroidobacteraceae bacterium]
MRFISRSRWLRLLGAIALLWAGWLQAPLAHANSSCAPATTQGTAPSDYQNYCWLDFSGYSDALAQGGGQPFAFTLPDGSTLSLTLSVSTSGANPALHAAAVPSWSGAAFGNSAFLGIPGNPVLYESQSGSTVTATLSNISITPPGGSSGTQTTYAIVAADGESTNNGESLAFTTNGTPWTQLAQIANGSYFPTLAGVGTTTVTETGTQGGAAGSFVFGSFSNPTVVTATMIGSGLQGVVFAVRFASVSVTTAINGNRVDASDQFTYAIKTTGGALLATQTSTGSGSGPFPLASAPTIAASYPFAVSEAMAAGSASTLANYVTSLTCTNGSTSGSTTVVPTNAKVISYTFPALQYGDAIACVFAETPYPDITGFVYEDLNHNGRMDPGEAGTGLSTIYVKLATLTGGVCQSPATVVVAANAATGAYTLPGVPAGSYCLIQNGDSTPSNIAPADPAGWVGIEAASGVRELTLGASAPSTQNFGLYQGMSISGSVFADTGSGAGIANNGAEDGGEVGIANVTVNAVAAGSAVGTALTTGAGSYALWIPASVSGSVVITPLSPNGDLATGGSTGSSGGTYTRPGVTLTASSGAAAVGVNFGLVPPNTLAPDGAKSAAPGTIVFYAHTFVAGSAGQVTFSSSATATPALGGWTETLYQDSNCNGQLDSGEPALVSPVSVTAGQSVCVLVKEFVPANAPINAENRVLLSAAFSYGNANPTLAATASRTDTTTVSASGAVLLSKLVSNVTEGTAAGTSNNASPGNTLQYRLTVSNPGSTPISQLTIDDSTPAYTGFLSAACPAAAGLPAGLSACSVSAQPAVGGQGALLWTFTGSLTPGAQVIVSYQVTVNP